MVKILLTRCAGFVSLRAKRSNPFKIATPPSGTRDDTQKSPNSKILSTDKKGMTLIEVVVAASIFTFIMGTMITVIQTSNTSWTRQNAAVMTQREARRALIYLTRDLRSASNFTITSSADVDTYTFSSPTDGNVTYTWNKSGPNTNQLNRESTSPASTKIVGFNIIDFNINIDNVPLIIIKVQTSISNAQGINLGSYQLKEYIVKRII